MPVRDNASLPRDGVLGDAVYDGTLESFLKGFFPEMRQ